MEIAVEGSRASFEVDLVTEAGQTGRGTACQVWARGCLLIESLTFEVKMEVMQDQIGVSNGRLLLLCFKSF